MFKIIIEAKSKINHFMHTLVKHFHVKDSFESQIPFFEVGLSSEKKLKD